MDLKITSCGQRLMTDKPTQILCDFVKAYGKEIINDPIRFRNLIKDFYKGEFKKEQKCLTDAIEEDIPKILLEKKQQLSYQILSFQLIQRLTDIGYTLDLAQWTVNSWAIALNVIPPTKLVVKPKTQIIKQQLIKSKQTPSFPKIVPIYSPVNMQKNKITGKYEQNKFVLLLAGICFVLPFFLLNFFPNANVEANGLFDQLIAWSALLCLAIFFILLAAYGGYLFRIES